MITNFYDQTVILLDRSTSTGAFTTGESYTTDVSIDAAVNLLSANEAFQFDRMGVAAEYKMFCAVSTEVYYGRRCRWGSDTFEIVSEPKNTMQKGHHYRVLLKRL